MSDSWAAATATTNSLMSWWGSNQLLAAAQKHAQEAAETAANLARKATELAEQAAETAKVLVVQASEEAPKLLSIAPQAEAHANKEMVAPSAEDLQLYGVNPDMVAFAKGLTYSTFSDYPTENLQPLFPIDKPRPPDSKSFQLSPWQERHARLVLQSVPQLQDLRFVLCPRRMSDEEFWTIYFNSMRAHLPHQAFGWHNVVESRPPLAPRSQARPLLESGRVSSNVGQTSGTCGTLSPAYSSHRDNVSVGDSSSMVMVDKWSEIEGEQALELENDPDLDAYLQEALTIDDNTADAAGDDVSNAEDLDDYLDQLDAEIQGAAAATAAATASQSSG